jgi:hypothetical protein
MRICIFSFIKKWNFFKKFKLKFKQIHWSRSANINRQDKVRSFFHALSYFNKKYFSSYFYLACKHFQAMYLALKLCFAVGLHNSFYYINIYSGIKSIFKIYEIAIISRADENFPSIFNKKGRFQAPFFDIFLLQTCQSEPFCKSAVSNLYTFFLWLRKNNRIFNLFNI